MKRRNLLGSALLIGVALAPASASAQAPLEPSAPENLRCVGRAGPRDGYHFEAQWQDFATFPQVALEGQGRPRGIALDHSCNVYVADAGGNQIVKFGPDGQQLAAWTMQARPASNEGVVGVAVAPDGTIYVADASQSVVRKLSPSGQVLAVWKSCDCQPGQIGWMVSPISVAVDGSGNNVYVLDEASETVTRFNSDGKPQKVFGTEGEGPGQFSVPERLSLDRQGNVYVADWGNHRIEKFSPDGALLGQFGTDGSGPGQMHLPSGIAVDRDGNMFVSDSDNWRVLKLAPDGTPVAQYPPCVAPGDCDATSGSDPGQFYDHTGLAVDGQGNLYVSDSGNDRVERLILVEVPNPPDAGASTPAALSVT